MSSAGPQSVLLFSPQICVCYETRSSTYVSFYCWSCAPRLLATVKSILKHDGIRGMYRGLGPTILGYLPTWAIYFAVYDGIKNHFGEKPVDETQVQRLYPAAQTKGYQPVAREHPWTLHILSAMTAGATSTLCTNPLWVIKPRFMVRHTSHLVFFFQYNMKL